MIDYQLIMNQTCCVEDLPKDRQWIGATIFYPDPEDGTRRELNIYWTEAPNGAVKVTLESIETLSIAEIISAPGLKVKIKNGKIVEQ